MVYGERYRDRTYDLFGVNEVFYYWTKRPASIDCQLYRVMPAMSNYFMCKSWALWKWIIVILARKRSNEHILRQDFAIFARRANPESLFF